MRLLLTIPEELIVTVLCKLGITVREVLPLNQINRINESNGFQGTRAKWAIQFMTKEKVYTVAIKGNRGEVVIRNI